MLLTFLFSSVSILWHYSLKLFSHSRLAFSFCHFLTQFYSSITSLFSSLLVSIFISLLQGDDTSDEPMFQHLNKLTASVTSPTATCTSPQEEVFAYTVTVGKKTSAAQSYVEDPAAVMDVLSTLIKSAQRDRRTSSACDLATMSLGSQAKQHYLSYKVALFQIDTEMLIETYFFFSFFL